MNLLSVWDSGALFPVLTILALAGVIWFGYQAYKAHNSGWKQNSVGVNLEGEEKIPYWKIPQTYGVLIVIALYIVAYLVIRSDYK